MDTFYIGQKRKEISLTSHQNHSELEDNGMKFLSPRNNTCCQPRILCSVKTAFKT